jgi:hypothetical protein
MKLRNKKVTKIKKKLHKNNKKKQLKNPKNINKAVSQLANSMLPHMTLKVRWGGCINYPLSLHPL